MPAWTLIVVVGAWFALAALTALAWRFNRGRGDDPPTPDDAPTPPDGGPR